MRKTQAENTGGKPLWKIALGVVLIAVSSAVIATDGGDVLRHAKWMGWLATGDLFSMPAPENPDVRSPAGHEKRLLFGDVDLDSPVAAKEALWRSQANDPAYFAEYAAAYLGQHDKLPPDFLETSRRIDPDNAWFTHLGAAAEAKNCVKKNSRKGRLVDGKFIQDEAPSWQILDQARLDRAMALLHEAKQQPKCETYSAKMLRRRQAMLSYESLIDALESYSFLGSASSFVSLHTRPVSQAIAARAWVLSEADDLAGFKELLKNTNAFLTVTLGTEAGVLVDELMFAVHATTIAENLSPAAAKLGLHDEAARWQKIADRLAKRKEQRDSRIFTVDGKQADGRVVAGGICGSSLEMVSKQAENPPNLTDADLKPGRIIDHEILSRLFAYALWLFFVIPLGLTACYRLRVPAEIRISARLVEKRLILVDWAWILGAGVIVPFAYVMAINRFTPLGGRDFGMLGTELLMPAAHFAGLLVLWLVAPLQIIRWRLSLRTEASDMRSSMLPGGLVVICALAFVPVVGVAALSIASGEFGTPWPVKTALELEPEETGVPSLSLLLALGLLAIPVIWLAQASLRAVFSRGDRLSGRAATARLLIPAYALAMLVAISTVPFFRMSEQTWFARETLMKPDPKFPLWSRYEYRVAVQVRKELREILSMVP